MEHVDLTGSGLVTSRIGLGLAGVFSAPLARDRRAVLETAWEQGVRHYDVAPMYGLGRAEAELGQFLRGRRDEATITTKFGIGPSPVARALGRVQSPLRALLARAPKTKRGVQQSGAAPGAGAVGGILYRAPGWTPASAADSLRRSLDQLGTDVVDVLALHEPTGDPVGSDALADALDAHRREGRVRAWGVAGEQAARQGDLQRRAGVLQHPDDLLRPAAPQVPGRTTYGWLSGALPAVRALLERDPAAAAVWSATLEADLGRPDVVVALLLREALRRNPLGVVLFSTTMPAHVVDTVRAAQEPSHPHESRVLTEIAARCTTAGGDGRP